MDILTNNPIWSAGLNIWAQLNPLSKTENSTAEVVLMMVTPFTHLFWQLKASKNKVYNTAGFKSY